MLNIISEACEAIFEALKTDYLRAPKGSEDWEKFFEKFEELRDFPHHSGGKHMRIEWPKNRRTLYYIYKGYYSIVLFTVCYTNFCFTLFVIGSYGSNNNRAILANSGMGARLENQSFNLPRNSDLIGSYFNSSPFLFLVDEIFTLRTWPLRPSPVRNLLEDERVHN